MGVCKTSFVASMCCYGQRNGVPIMLRTSSSRMIAQRILLVLTPIFLTSFCLCILAPNPVSCNLIVLEESISREHQFAVEDFELSHEEDEGEDADIPDGRDLYTDSELSTVNAVVEGVTDVASRRLLISLESYQDASPEHGIYHNFALFEQDYAEMEKKFRIFVYPEAHEEGKEFSNVFLPHTNPRSKNIGNYFSEHQFKIALLPSQFVTKDPNTAHLFYLPFSVNVMRNDMRIRTEPAIGRFVKEYIKNVSQDFEYWNRSAGADHFFACCHSVGRDVPQALPGLRSNAIQLICSSNYYYKNYIPHKDVPLPQVWPRKPLLNVNPPEKRKRLAFYAGRIQNSVVRKTLIELWGADPDMDFYGGGSNGSYEQHFANSKFCVHVRGYEVNTARISDAIHFGCVPVIISDYYDLPLSDVLDWNQFAIIVSYSKIPNLKKILLSFSEKTKYAALQTRVLHVRKHFQWNNSPLKYDVFHMSMYQLWLKRFVIRDSRSLGQGKLS